jgi:molecular chaperone DnaJ
MSKEYYQILGVDENASADEIKKSYRKKAMEVHPDRHGGDKAKEAEFKKLNEAYSVLSDETKKANYDRFGSAEGMGGGGGFGGFQWGFDVDLGDIFSSFFGGGMGWGGRGRRSEVGADIEIKLQISLEDAIRGSNRQVSYKKKIHCHTCNSTGWKTEKCATCNGNGQVRARVQTMFGVIEQAQTCGSCSGRGERVIEKCSACHGDRHIIQSVDKTIDIPAGIEDGMSIKLRDEGHEGKDGNGDLYITFLVPEKEGGLERDGTDLHYTVGISPAAGAIGQASMIDIPIIGKKPLDIKAGTQGGTTIRFREEWLPRLDRKWQKGDLIIHIEIEIPTKLSSDQKALYEALLKTEWGKKMKKWWLEEIFGG